MTGREHFHQMMARESSRSGFWHGNAHRDSLPALDAYFGVKGDMALGQKLGDMLFWAHPGEWDAWRHPEGKPMFDVLGGKPRVSLSQPGAFSEASLADVDTFPWPDVRYLDFTRTFEAIDRARAQGMAIFSGMWSCFFHNAMDLFGMESYFIAMYEEPELVDAVTQRVCAFYLEANELFYKQAEGRVDAFFFGNDFGSQLDMLISPESFDRFVMPYFRMFTDQAKGHGLRVALHSCGSIWRVIDRLIEAGVDVLHPIQARAAGMDAERLSRLYGDRVVFMGGLDTQELMPFGTPQQVKDEVHRLRDLFGPNFILSPSHECILPVVPPRNIEAMAEAAHD